MNGRKILTIVFALVLGIAISVILVFVQTASLKKTVEMTFNTTNKKIMTGAVQHGVNIYISENEDGVSEEILKKREGAKELNGGPFEDSFKQMRCFASKLVSGINSSDIETVTGQLSTQDKFAYYDENMANIMMENTLLYVKRDIAGGSNAEVFYTYSDDALTEVMNGLMDKNVNTIGTFVFEVNGLYTKGDEFVPKSIKYYSVGEGGTKQDGDYIPTAAKTPEEMIADGYEYVTFEDQFRVGDISDNSDYITYCYAIKEEPKAKMEEVLKNAVDNGELDTVIRGKESLFTVEYYRVSKYDVPEMGKSIYTVSYKRSALLYEIFGYGMFGGRGLLYIEWFIIQTVLIILLSVVIALIINKITAIGK